VTLEIADLLVDGPAAVDELAAARGCDGDALHRVLRHLSTKGVFEEPRFGVFAINGAARELLEPHTKLYFGLDGIGCRFANVSSTLLPYVRTGRPAYREVFGVDFWEDLTVNPHIGASFDMFMDVAHASRDGSFPLAEGWDRLSTVVDVGGGTGALLAAILRAHPHVRGVLVDLPATVARSAEGFEQAGVADRVTTVGQSFFDPLPPCGDLYVPCGIINVGLALLATGIYIRQWAIFTLGRFFTPTSGCTRPETPGHGRCGAPTSERGLVVTALASAQI
jgi:hypothetical protein